MTITLERPVSTVKRLVGFKAPVAPVEVKAPTKLSTFKRPRAGVEVSWHSDVKAEVAVAEKAVEQALADGDLIFKVENGENEMVKSFNPTDETLIAVPRLVGG